MPISLKQLNYFHTLASTGSFAAAAERVHISQPAMSLQIKALEQEFGARLVERGRTGITLTGLGREVDARAQVILQQVDDLATIAVNSRDRPIGPTRLGLIPTIAPYLLPECFPKLRREFAKVEFVIREGKTETLIEELHHNQLDLAIMALPFDQRGLETRELFNDAFVVATGPGYKPKSRSAITVDEINNNPLLLLEQGHCLRDQTIEVCGNAGSNAHNAFTATSLSTILEMVANDYGLTLLPEMSLAKEANDPRIRLIPLAPPVPSRKIVMVWRKSSSYGPFYNEIGDLIIQPVRNTMPT